jgi:hypothetical protein
VLGTALNKHLTAVLCCPGSLASFPSSEIVPPPSLSPMAWTGWKSEALVCGILFEGFLKSCPLFWQHVSLHPRVPIPLKTQVCRIGQAGAAHFAMPPSDQC